MSYKEKDGPSVNVLTERWGTRIAFALRGKRTALHAALDIGSLAQNLPKNRISGAVHMEV